MRKQLAIAALFLSASCGSFASQDQGQPETIDNDDSALTSLDKEVCLGKNAGTIIQVSDGMPFDTYSICCPTDEGIEIHKDIALHDKDKLDRFHCPDI